MTTSLHARVEGVRDYVHVRWHDREVELALATLHQRARRRRAWRTGAALAVAAAMIALVFHREFEPSPANPLALPASEAPVKRASRAAAAQQPQSAKEASSPPFHAVTLPDGSRYRTLAPSSRLELLHVSDEHVHMALSAGSARFEVSDRKERTFRVAVGAVTVEVMGTTFAVERDERDASEQARVRVTVHEGRVRVGWDSGEAVLKAGDSRWFPPVEADSAATAPTRRPAIARAPRTRAVDPAPTWRHFASQGHYAKAYQMLNSAERARSEQVRDEPRDLFLAADSARLAGHPQRALPYLRRIVDRHPRDARATLAAFTVGRLQLELGRSAKAAAAFARARALDENGPLAEDALARETEAWSKARRRTTAHARAELYLRRHPAGRHTASVRRWGRIRNQH